MSTRPARRSGDGWRTTADGRVFWGRFGASGLLVRHRPAGGTVRFLIARRAAWVHRGNGRWAIPGGARDEGEPALAAALREFDEELGRLPSPWRLRGSYVDDVAPGEWSYVTCCIDVDEAPVYHRTLSLEHDEARWVTREELGSLPLFAPFARALPHLLAVFERGAPGGADAVHDDPAG